MSHALITPPTNPATSAGTSRVETALVARDPGAASKDPLQELEAERRAIGEAVLGRLDAAPEPVSRLDQALAKGSRRCGPRFWSD